MSCCDDFGSCRQGRDCPVRRANSFPLVTGCSLKAPPRPIEPVPVDRKDRRIHLAQWLALSAVLVATVAATAGFFTHK